MTALRRALRDADVEVRVVKNRLFQLAADQAGVAQAAEVAEGPTLVVFGYGDIIAPAKAIAITGRELQMEIHRPQAMRKPGKSP
jgi:large subunit ribosomal protein L10